MSNDYMQFIQKNMDVAAYKRNVISDNVANYNTPGFKAEKVSFDQMFAERSGLSMKGTDGKHLSGSTNPTEPTVYQDTATSERLDGNNVDLNVEMIDTIKNNSYYTKAVQAINKEFYLQKTAIGK